MYVDPVVCRKKFEREIANCNELADYYRKRGILVLDATFPTVFVMFVAVNAKPAPMIPFGAVIDFSNYDVEPPSVKLVHPFTRTPLKRSDVAYNFVRMLPPQGEPQAAPVFQDLLQAFVDEQPFLCLQGIKEYHDSAAHSGDSWFLHRGTGAGSLGFLLDVISKYGADPIRGPGINVNLAVNGFAIQLPTQ